MKKPTLFECEDREGRSVRLRKEVFDRHVTDRPEMASYIEEARLTVSDPDYQLDDDNDSNAGEITRIYYKMGLGRGKFAKCFLMVPVFYDSTQEGEVATFHFTRRIGKGVLVWQRG